MTFLALDAQKSLYTLQKNQLNFEQTLVISRASYISKQMGIIQEGVEDASLLDSDPTYIQLQTEEEQLEVRKESLDSQVQLLEQEISNLKTAVTNGIKNGCGLNLIGG